MAVVPSMLPRRGGDEEQGEDWEALEPGMQGWF